MSADQKSPEGQWQPGAGPRHQGPSLAAFSACSAILIGLAFPLVLLGHRSFFFRDYGVIGYPFVYFHREQFWSGNWFPLWNPLSNCGAPFLAQWGTMVLYPFNLIYLLFPLPWSLGLFCLAHLFLGSVGMFLLARRWTGDSMAGTVAGMAYAFNGFTLSALVWPNYQVALAWLPFVILTVESAWQQGGRHILVAAVACSLMTLAGVPEVLLMSCFALLAWCLSDPSWNRQHTLTRLCRLVAVALLVLGLTAAQTLPFLDLLTHSQRGAGFATSKWAMPAWGWAHFLVPLFHCFMTPQGTWFQEGQEFVSSYYPGVGILFIALLALTVRRDRRTWCLAALGLLGFLLALGETGLVLPLLRRVFPSLGVARYPVKALVLVTLSLPLLAAAGLNSRLANTLPTPKRFQVALFVWWGLLAIATLAVLVWARRHPFPYDQWGPTWKNGMGRLLALSIAATGLYGLGLNWKAHQRNLICGALVVLCVVDGLVHWPHLIPTMPAANLQPQLAREALALSPAPQVGMSRVLISPAAEEKLLHSGVSDWEADFLGKRRALWSNLNALEGIPKVNGSSTLQIREQAEVQKLIYGPPGTEPPGLLDFLAVAHITKPGTVVEWTNRPSALPWVTAGQTPQFGDKEEVLRNMASAEFAPRATVWLPKSNIPEPPAQAVAAAHARLLNASSETLRFLVETPAPAWAVVAQTYHPHWQATVDSQPTTLVRANHAFQAVVVPAGQHTVELRYVDGPFRLGGGITCCTLLVVALFWARFSMRTA